MIIVVSSRSGGVGKSTASIHLAAYLAQRRGAGKVALVDADSNETCLDWVQRGEGQPFDVLSSSEENFEDYNHLIIDTAAAPDSDELAEILESSDLLVIPTTPSMADLSPAIATAQEFELDEGDVTLLLTLCPPAPSKVGAIALQAIQKAELPVISQTLTRRNCYLEAIALGLHVGQMKTPSAKKAWHEWKKIGREIYRG